MGRLPKGFKKTLTHKHDGPDADPEPTAVPPPAPATGKAQEDKQKDAPNAAFLKDAGSSSSQGAPPPKSPQPAAPAVTHPDSDDEDGEEAGTGTETRGQVIQRHKKEAQAFKKNLPRLGKKSKEEIAKLTAELEAKHAKELAEFDSRTAAQPAGQEATQENGDGGAANAAQQDMSNLQVADHDEEEAGGKAGGGKKTKAMKRREKAAAAEAEREARIAAEVAEAGPSARAQEEEALVQLLTPLGLRMREIRADGHCLYRSLADQLMLAPAAGAAASHMDFQQLRAAAAAHIRKHPDQYAHYIDLHDGESLEQAVDRYCNELENTAAWGGQLELSVLAQVLKRPIQVYTVGLPSLMLGDEYKDAAEPLQVCYLRHAFGLGEHYNSLEPAASAS